MPQKRIIIDINTSVDGAFALLLALASPEIQLEALTTTQGNVSIEKATWNALSILKLCRVHHIPVAQGSTVPLVQPLRTTTHESGISGFQLPEPATVPVPKHAVDYLINCVLGNPQEITLVSLGPLTNIAMAIRKEPRFASSVKELVVVGGAILDHGNITPQAEFNIHVDPYAAHIVFHAGIPTTLIPLDVTRKCLLLQAHVERLMQIGSPLPSFIRDALQVNSEWSFDLEYPGLALHEPLAFATSIAPALLILKEYYVDVDISGGISMGKTFADILNVTKKPMNMKVAMQVRAEDFMELFLQRVETLARKIQD
jgi:purine nucleosidase